MGLPNSEGLPPNRDPLPEGAGLPNKESLGGSGIVVGFEDAAAEADGLPNNGPFPIIDEPENSVLGGPPPKIFVDFRGSATGLAGVLGVGAVGGAGFIEKLAGKTDVADFAANKPPADLSEDFAALNSPPAGLSDDAAANNPPTVGLSVVANRGPVFFSKRETGFYYFFVSF